MNASARAAECCMAPSWITWLAALCLLGASAKAAPPVAEVHNVPIQLHGTQVDDPYRWLEDIKSAPAQAWLHGQGEHARQVLDRIEGRADLARRLAELTAAEGDSIRGLVQMPGERYYYLKRAVGEQQFKLVVRRGLTGAERVLVDPEVPSRQTGVPHAINYFSPSWDGRHLAYGLSAGGSEDASLHILHVASGKRVGAPIPHVYDTPMHWLPDSRSLTFTQLTELKAGAPDTDTYKDSRVMWLHLGGQPRAVFGPQVTPALGLDRLDVAEIITVLGSRWMVARTTDTTVPEGKLFVAPLKQLGRSRLHWRRLAGDADKVVSVALQGEHLYVMTQAGVPRRQIVRVDLRKGSLAEAPVVVQQPAQAVLEDFETTPTGLVTELRVGTGTQLRRHVRGDVVGQVLPLPAAGSAWLAQNPAGNSEALLLAFASWTEPQRWLRLWRGQFEPVSLGRRSVPTGVPEIVVRDVEVPSHDGVTVPMTVLHRLGLPLDGRNPVLLHGYAAYGFSMSARYAAEDMLWLQSGGVLAFSNPRGSGVHGDDWHRAGFKTTKPNTWKDGIACARWLIAQGYGSARTMGIMGTSAGGIFVGRAVTEAPELFAAAIFNVGELDTVRSEVSANGATNISEFGTVKDPIEARALLQMSTYNAIRDGTAYPGVLLVHGLNDPRVDVWHSAKTAARLQAAQAGLAQSRPVLLRLDEQAGHGVGSTLTQYQAQGVDMQSFLLWQMGKLALRD